MSIAAGKPRRTCLHFTSDNLDTWDHGFFHPPVQQRGMISATTLHSAMGLLEAVGGLHPRLNTACGWPPALQSATFMTWLLERNVDDTVVATAEIQSSDACSLNNYPSLLQEESTEELWVRVKKARKAREKGGSKRRRQPPAAPISRSPRLVIFVPLQCIIHLQSLCHPTLLSSTNDECSKISPTPLSLL